MRRSPFRAAVFLCILALPLQVLSKDVYVSTSGDDAQPGTAEQPVASLERAVELMEGVGGGTIWMAPGEYYLEKGIVLGSRHAGSGEQPLTIRGRAAGKVRLTGARRVTDWEPIASEAAESLVSVEARKHVLVADLTRQGFPALTALPAKHRAHGCEEVVFGDRVMQSARWPNADFAVFTEVIDAGASKPVHWVTREVYRPGSFRFPGDRAKHWDFDRGVWLHGFWCYDWCDEALRAASYDANSGELRLAAKPAYGVGNPWKEDSARRFYALHVFEELDQPGEYYLDRQEGRLYFWPPGDVTSTPVRLTLCQQPLLRGEGVAHLVLRDLTIENGRAAGVQLRNCHHCRVEKCVIRNTGGSGIDLNGTQLTAIGCEVTGTASYGISLSGGDRKTLTPGKCSVRSCHIHHVGRLDWMGGRGIRISGCGNRIANNLIHHGPTGAVSYGGNEHLLELNEVHDVCIHYSDVGVFYTGRDWASRGNIVRWNYIHDNVNNRGHGSSGIYLDDCDSGDTVTGNIVYGGVGRGVLLGGGRDNVIRGNIFVGLPIGIHVDARGPRGITLDKPGSWNLLAKCRQVGYQSSLWKQRYPRLATIMDNEPLMPLGNKIHANIIVDCEKPFALAKDVDPQWLDRDRNLVADLEEFPWLPRPGSAEKVRSAALSRLWQKVPGFEPIPVDRIGLRDEP